MRNGGTWILLGMVLAASLMVLLAGLHSAEHPQRVVDQTNPKTNTVHYLSLEFRQSSFTLSIGQHIRDAANAFSITIPTTKEFYNSVSVGDELGSKFKGASFILSGNIGKRKVIVKDKFTRKE